MSSLSYIEKNRGRITASKLKTFIKSPEAYYLQYIKEVQTEDEPSRALILGTAFDDFLTYGPVEFNKKYFLDEGLTVAGLVEKCFERGLAPTGKEKKEELLFMAYGDVSKKIRLTEEEGNKVRGMMAEGVRQPLWDIHGAYDKQKTIEGMYKGKLKLGGTLDRFSKDRGLIRDYKTTGNLKNFSFELASKFGYEISMAFYFALAKMVEGVECDIYLDVVQSSGVYQSEVFCYTKEKMNMVLVETIFPALDKLFEMTEEFEKTGDENIWKNASCSPRYELYDLDTYPILEGGLQTSISYL